MTSETEGGAVLSAVKVLYKHSVDPFACTACIRACMQRDKLDGTYLTTVAAGWGQRSEDTMK